MARLFDVLLGRTKPVQSNLDALFGLVGAQITLQASESLVSRGTAGVCYKPIAGRSFSDTALETAQLLGVGDTSEAAAGVPDATAPKVSQSDDSFGYHWVVISLPDFQELVNETHLVNTTLQENGYGPQLLCSVFAFGPDPATPPSAGSGVVPLGYLVYLYKRGSFYPFVPAPAGGEQRDIESELRLSHVLSDDLAIETDKERWMPLWGLPVH